MSKIKLKSDTSNTTGKEDMNRVIKFRGFSVENNKWVYGFYWSDKPFLDIRHYIRINGKESLQVAPKSVGEFTGLTDKEGKEIYEGDVVRISKAWYRGGLSAGAEGDIEAEINKPEFLIAWNSETGAFVAKDINHNQLGLDVVRGVYLWLITGDKKNCEVIGNIYEHDFLLEQK